MINFIPIVYLALINIHSAETAIQLFIFVLAGYHFSESKFFHCYFLKFFYEEWERVFCCCCYFWGFFYSLSLLEDVISRILQIEF